MSDDDRQLLIKTRDGHEPAARLLWERHAPRLLAYSRAILPPWLSPEDVVQSVFCRVVALDRATIREVADVAAWLTGLVRREALNAVRGARREHGRLERRAVLDADNSAASAGSPGDAREPLERALDRLPRRLREVVALRHVSGLTFDQIALALAVNRSTAATRYRAAIDALRRVMGASEPGGAGPPVAVEVVHG